MYLLIFKPPLFILLQKKICVEILQKQHFYKYSLGPYELQQKNGPDRFSRLKDDEQIIFFTVKYISCSRPVSSEQILSRKNARTMQNFAKFLSEIFGKTNFFRAEMRNFCKTF